MTRRAQPLLAVLTGPAGAPAGARELLVRLARWADVRAASTHGRRATAWFAAGPTAAGIVEPAGAGHPLAVWVERSDQVEAAQGLLSGEGSAAITFVTGDPDVADALAGAHVLVIGGPSGSAPPLARSPFVRRRWRRRSAFPDGWVVRIGAGAELVDENDGRLVATALSLCAAAVVDHPTVLRTALAAGAPTVTDAATAAGAGAVDGVHVVVANGEDGDRLAAARRLAEDDRQAAALGRAATQLFADRHHPDALARRLADRLGLSIAGDTPHDRAEAMVEALGTPPHARPIERLRQALDALP